MTRGLTAGALAVLALACGGDGDEGMPEQAAPRPEAEPPVALNADVPIGYPPALFEQKIEGEVVLRLFTDSTGRLVPESTRVAESSGYPALDSAALAGAPALRFAPAKRHGIPVATAFLQPVDFRQATPGAAATSGADVSPPAVPPAPAVRVPRPRPPAPPPAPPPPPPPAPAAPQPDTTRRDTTRSDTTRVRPVPQPAPAPPPAPPPSPPAPPPSSGAAR